MTTLVLCALEGELSASSVEEAHVVYTGLGKLNAALTAHQAIVDLKPSVVINFGTAGGVSPRAKGLLSIKKVLQRDMIAEPLAPRGTTPFCSYPAVYDSTVETDYCCATGDSFVMGNDAWFQVQGVDVVDMELYAIATVCHRLNVPWLAYKYVSDQADEKAADEWQANVSTGQELFLQQLRRL